MSRRSVEYARKIQFRGKSDPRGITDLAQAILQHHRISRGCTRPMREEKAVRIAMCLRNGGQAKR